MNITINLITNLQETVPNTVLTKILTIKRNGGLVNLTGNIYIPAAYVNEVLEFCTYFGLTEDENTPGTYRGNNIILSVGTSYISFEDNEVARIINGTFGSDGHTTALLAKNAVFTSSTFKNNTVILTFPEFNLFTKANNNPPASLFEGCSNLSNIDLSEITKLSVREFYGTSITDVNAPNLTTVPNESSHIFSNNSSLLTITNIGHISYIPQDMCWSCPNLESVNLPNECTTINAGAFYSGNLLTVTGLEHISNFGGRSFFSLEYLTISTRDLSNAMNIADTAFYKVNLLSINCPKLISLGGGAFWGGENVRLSSVECLGKVLEIPNHCFLYRTLLLTAKIPYECTKIGDEGFLECFALTTIKQYTQSVDDWVEGTDPSYGDITRVTLFGNNAFMACRSLILNASALSSAVTIGNRSFENCSLLTGTLNLPNLISLGQLAFYYTGITSIVDLGNITALPYQCFLGCSVSSINQSVVDLITSWGWLSLLVSGNAASTIKPGPNTKRITAGIIGVNNPNAVVYLPLITRSVYGRDLADGDCHCPFNFSYNSGVARNIYGLIYMPNLSLIEDGYGGWPYQRGLAVDTTADLFYIKSVSTLTPGTFSQCDISHIVINNTTPPNLVDTQDFSNETGGLKKCIFSYNGSLSGIYVPDSAVNSYKTAWGDVLAVTPVNNTTLSQDIIKPISSLNNGVIYATENDWISDGRPSALIAEYMGLSTADLATFVSANNLTYYTPSSN